MDSAICAVPSLVKVNRISSQWCEYRSLVERLYNLRQTDSPAGQL